MSDVIVLSPHLDDAVLSLGAAIARWSEEGRRVEVWTVYTDGPPLDSIPAGQRAFGDYEVRRAEDEDALGLIGARGRHLGVWERIWHAPPVSGVTGVFRTPGTVAGFASLEEVTAIAEAAFDRPDTEVFAPLGVGRHVDHVELALAAWRAAEEREALHRLRAYEDFYALSERARRAHPVAARRPFALRDAPGRAVALGLPAVGALGLVGRGPQLDHYAPSLAAAPWHLRALPCGPAEELRKLAAVAAYRSQAALLGPLARSLPHVLRRSHARRAGELVWHPV